MLGELLCGQRDDMPDVVKERSSRLPKGLDIGMVRVSMLSQGIRATFASTSLIDALHDFFLARQQMPLIIPGLTHSL